MKVRPRCPECGSKDVEVEELSTVRGASFSRTSQITHHHGGECECRECGYGWTWQPVEGDKPHEEVDEWLHNPKTSRRRRSYGDY